MPIGARVMRRVLRVWKSLILGALRRRRVSGVIEREKRGQVVVRKLRARLKTKGIWRRFLVVKTLAGR